MNIDKLLKDLSKAKPVPGGGAAACLVSLTGIACLLKTINFTINKKGYEEVYREVNDIKKRMMAVKLDIEKYLRMDIKYFNSLTEAKKLPKITVLQLKKRNNKIQYYLKKSTDVMFHLIQKNYELLKMANRIAAIGNKFLITDTASGVLFLVSSTKAARLNIMINIKDIKDIEYKKEVRSVSKSLEIKSIRFETSINKLMYSKFFEKYL